MASLRDRISDALLRVATANALDREQLARGVAAVPPSTAGYSSAMGAIACAGWVDSAMLWLSWRLRSNRLPDR